MIKLYLCGTLTSKILLGDLKITMKKARFQTGANKNTVEEILLPVFLVHCVFVALYSVDRWSTSFEICYQASEWCLSWLTTQIKENGNCTEKKKEPTCILLENIQGEEGNYHKHSISRSTEQDTLCKILYKRENVGLQLEMWLNGRTVQCSLLPTPLCICEFQQEREKAIQQ